MSKILFIIPDEHMVPYVKEILSSDYPDIKVVSATPEKGIKLVQSHIDRGLEVVAARAVTASAIRQAQMNISVVEIPTTNFDIIRAINEARLHGKRIAVIAHSGKILGIDFFASALGVNIRQYTVSYKQDYEKEILEACSDGAEVILGGVNAAKSAKRLGIPFTLINIGKEGLLQAAREAKQIQEALEIEAAKRGFYGSILDYSYEGIVTIDREHCITAFNPAARKLTNISNAEALGQPIEKVLPQLDLEKVMENGKDVLNSIIGINSVKVLCNKVPIIINNKPFGAVATFQDISRIQELEAMIRQEVYSRGHIAKFRFEDIAGESPVFMKVIQTARDFAATNSNILILGETGTGKEVFAQSIHNGSEHSKGPFIALNCAALPSQILESELFGYVRGAFTGANKEGKPGLFEVAHKGTIFLDEISEMDYANQGRLLRFLQEKTIVRLGSHKVIPVDVRVIAATNKDLETLSYESKFRSDLYFRLNVLSLELPPLRERKSDIRIYAGKFLDEFLAGSGRDLRLTKDAVKTLEKYNWPGNVRELRNLMERITATAKMDIINSSILLEMFRQKRTHTINRSPKEERIIRDLKKALEDSKGNYTAAAEILGINRSTLWRRMQKFKIEY